MTNIELIGDDIFVGNNPKKNTLEFKMLEYSMLINLNLYKEEKIDRNVYDKMRNSLLKRMTKILS